MEKFEKYLAAFDGAADWSQIEPLFDDLFHPDLLVLTADGEMDRTQWAEMAKGLADRGATVSGFEVTDEADDTILYRLTIHVGDDDPMHLQARGTVVRGQLARVEPMDPDAYSEMVDRSR